MRFPGDILIKHQWILLFAVLTVILSIPFGANKQAYEYYIKSGPKISWENIPESALTLFLWNFASALTSFFILPLLFLFLFRIFIIPGGFGLGFTIGISLWLISQNPLYIAVFSHGILEIYSAFLAVVGGYLLLVKVCEAIVGFFKLIPEYVNWKEVLRDYGSLFVFSIFGLFLSAWMEAFLGYAIIRIGSLVWLVVIVNTLVSLGVVSYLSFSPIRAILARKAKLAVTYVPEKEEASISKELPKDVWCICPKCGAYISANIEYCPCGAKLPKRPKKLTSKKFKNRH
jgi:uncharacterized membrane protein SpoIIM required for sporulation